MHEIQNSVLNLLTQFSRIRAGYKDLIFKSPYNVLLGENADQKTSEFVYFSGSTSTFKMHINAEKQVNLKIGHLYVYIKK